MTAPFFPEVVEINDVKKNEGNDDDRVIRRAVSVDVIQLDPHGKFIKGNAKCEAVD